MITQTVFWPHDLQNKVTKNKSNDSGRNLQMRNYRLFCLCPFEAFAKNGQKLQMATKKPTI